MTTPPSCHMRCLRWSLVTPRLAPWLGSLWGSSATSNVVPMTKCPCNAFQIDAFGDHLQTCQTKSAATQVHDWVVYRFGRLLLKVDRRSATFTSLILSTVDCLYRPKKVKEFLPCSKEFFSFLIRSSNRPWYLSSTSIQKNKYCQSWTSPIKVWWWLSHLFRLHPKEIRLVVLQNKRHSCLHHIHELEGKVGWNHSTHYLR